MQKEMRRDIESQLYKHTESWQPVINAVLKTIPDQQKDLFYLRYVERLTEREICQRMYIDRSYYYRLITGLINEIAITAAYYQLKFDSVAK